MIRATITDQKALSKLKLDDVISYMMGKGWYAVSTSELGYRFTNKLYDDIIPIAKECCSDYVRRLSQAIELLGELEDRSCLDIFEDMGGQIDPLMITLQCRVCGYEQEVNFVKYSVHTIMGGHPYTCPTESCQSHTELKPKYNQFGQPEVTLW